jgi:adenosine deaminase
MPFGIETSLPLISGRLTNLYDLHRHHDTSHTPESILRVAQLLSIERYANMSLEDIRREVQTPDGSTRNQWYQCLKNARKAYVSPMAVAELTRDVLRDAARQGLGLLELRLSMLSTVSAIRENNPTLLAKDFWTVARDTLEALLDIRRQETDTLIMPVDLILSISCQSKYLNFVDSYIDLMKDYASEIIAVDLTNEEENKPSTYKAALDRIRPHIPFLTIHCMETAGPERGWDALTLFPQRIGHGIRAIEDPMLLREIRRRNIVLEVCPLSNLLMGAATSSNHPFRRLDEAGLTLTINHDGLNDSRTLKDDYAFVRSTFGYSDADMRRFVQNGKAYAFRSLKSSL